MLTDPGSARLLSEAALARVTDARLAEPVASGDRWGPLRSALGLSRQLARRLPLRRHPWTPHPLPSDRTRLEYPAAGHQRAPVPSAEPA